MGNLISFFKFCFYTFLYLMGKRSAKEEIEAATDKKNLEETTRIYEESEATKEKFIEIKKKIPNEWGKRAS